MVSCPRCRSSGQVRPEGLAAPYSKQPCGLCFSEQERCPTGLVEARIAREWLDSHPNAPGGSIDRETTKVSCPSCEHCHHCHGTRMVGVDERLDLVPELGRRVHQYLPVGSP